MRTNIHQTNLTKCIKSLENKNLIKAVKSVKFPTRKIYILSELQPSVEHSGGPWYTDNELDTEFIGVLLQSIHKCLQDRVCSLQLYSFQFNLFNSSTSIPPLYHKMKSLIPRRILQIRITQLRYYIRFLTPPFCRRRSTTC